MQKRQFMLKRKLAVVMSVLALVAIMAVVSVGAAFAQTETPGAQTTPATPGTTQSERFGFKFGFGLRGGDTATFDAVAAALNLTPTQLFERLHAGESLSEIATAQGVDLATVQAAANASRVQAMKDRIADTVAAGTITQEQADWMLEGIEKGYTFGKGFGFGGRHGRGMRGLLDNSGTTTPTPVPSTSSFGTSS